MFKIEALPEAKQYKKEIQQIEELEKQDKTRTNVLLNKLLKAEFGSYASIHEHGEYVYYELSSSSFFGWAKTIAICEDAKKPVHNLELGREIFQFEQEVLERTNLKTKLIERMSEAIQDKFNEWLVNPADDPEISWK